jgi:hypothetical protein
MSGPIKNKKRRDKSIPWSRRDILEQCIKSLSAKGWDGNAWLSYRTLRDLDLDKEIFCYIIWERLLFVEG